jgi:hypothetical protein
VVVASILPALACGGQSLSRERDGAERGGAGSSMGGTGAEPGGGSAGALGGSAGSSTGTGGISTGGGGSNGTGGNAGEGGVCATTTISIGRANQNFFFALDRSQTLAGERWTNVVETLTLLFSNPDLTGTGITLGSFPDNAEPSECNDVTCSGEECGVPLVALGTLTGDGQPADAHETTLVRALRRLQPTGMNPPLSAALDGALLWAESERSENPGSTAHVILIATGEVNACEDTAADRASLAYAESGISTTVVAFDDENRALLNQIAISGGSNEMFVLGADPVVNAADLLQLMHLSTTDVSCEIALPTDSNGVLDLTDVTVEFTANGVSYPVYEVSGFGACLDGPGWYLNDPTTPSNVVLCPRTCTDSVSGDYETLVLWVGCSDGGGL